MDLMNGKTKIDAIFKRRNSGAPAFWTGNPHAETMARYLAELGLSDAEALYSYLGDEARWLPSDRAYRHPEGKPMFDPLGGKPRVSLSQAGVFAACESPAEVDAYPWPNPDYLDFTPVMESIRQKPDKAIWTGMWSPFFHDVADFFGMDNYFWRCTRVPTSWTP